MMTTGAELSDHVARNREHWDKLADEFVASGARARQMALGEEWLRRA